MSGEEHAVDSLATRTRTTTKTMPLLNRPVIATILGLLVVGGTSVPKPVLSGDVTGKDSKNIFHLLKVGYEWVKF